jgi:hypothetical protein
MEDAPRCDPTEGRAHTIEPDIVTVAWVSRNPSDKTIVTREQGYQEHHPEYGNGLFCFCTSLPDVNLDHMKESFGKYIVKINEPRKLAEDINEYFIRNGQRFLIVGCSVVYNKGQKLDKKLTNNERLDLAYKQKPEKFWPDYEFRIVAIKFGDPCNLECEFLDGQLDMKCKYIEVNLGKKMDYLSLVNT